MKKIVIAGGVLLLIGLAWWGSRPGPMEVEMATVGRGPLAVVLAEEGETRVRDRYEVSAPVAGRVQRIALEPGDQVVADETVLASFLPAAPVPLDARARAEANAAVEAARSALGGAQAEEKRAASELRFAAAEQARVSRLADSGVVSADELERATLAHETAEEAARAAAFSVAAARGELAAARARLLQDASPADGPVAIDLRSPVSGVVLRRMRESESVVAAGTPLIEVGDPDSLEIIADFLSSDAVRIGAGMSARITEWGGAPLAARVQRTEPSGFTKISALGVEEQRVNVILDLADGQPEARALGDAYRVEVEVEVWSSDDELLVDNGALFRRGEDWAVFEVVDGVAREVTVGIGRRGQGASQVLDGVEAGDVVVLYPPSSLTEGAAVSAAADG